MSDVPNPSTGSVRDWLEKNGISAENSRLTSLNWNQILGLKSHLASDPTSFYSSVQKNLGVDYMDVLTLDTALRNLEDKSKDD